MKRAINAYLRECVTEILSNDQTTPGCTKTHNPCAIVLDTKLLLTTKILIQNKFSPRSIVVPNPDPEECHGMLERCPGLAVYQGSTHQVPLMPPNLPSQYGPDP